jgi:lipopolysaccharide biosynthesis regulator YciM
MTVPAGRPLDDARPVDRAYLEARRLNDEGRPTEAIRILEDVLFQDDQHEDAAIELGATLMDVGRAREAIAHFEKLLKDHPAMVRVRLAFGQCLMRSEQLERAVVEFGAVVDQEPAWAAPFTPMIMALCRLGRVAEAKIKLESLRAVSSDAANIDMLTRLVTRTSRAN